MLYSVSFKSYERLKYYEKKWRNGQKKQFLFNQIDVIDSLEHTSISSVTQNPVSLAQSGLFQNPVSLGQYGLSQNPVSLAQSGLSQNPVSLAQSGLFHNPVSLAQLGLIQNPVSLARLGCLTIQSLWLSLSCFKIQSLWLSLYWKFRHSYWFRSHCLELLLKQRNVIFDPKGIQKRGLVIILQTLITLEGDRVEHSFRKDLKSRGRDLFISGLSPKK